MQDQTRKPFRVDPEERQIIELVRTFNIPPVVVTEMVLSKAQEVNAIVKQRLSSLVK